MDKRSRIWIIVLTLLLAAALALCVVFKLRLDDMSEKYEAVSAEDQPAATGDTEAEDQPAATGDTEAEDQPGMAGDAGDDETASAPAATVDPRDGEIAALNAELEEARARADELQTENDGLKAELAACSDSAVNAEEMQTELADVHAENETLAVRVTTAEAALAEAEKRAEAAETALAEAENRAETAEAALAEAERRAETAETALAEAEKRAETAEAQLAAYHTEFYAADGEKHLSAEADAVVRVSADGVSTEYAIANNASSGNSVIFELSLDGNTIYESPKLSPGQRVDSFKLNDVLEPGDYAASLSIKTMNSEGNVISTVVTPVTIEVAR